MGSQPDGPQRQAAFGTWRFSFWSLRLASLGNKPSSTLGAGDTTYFRYDLCGNVTGVRKPGMSTELRTAYDARGNKNFEADGNGNASTWAYDDFGRLVAHSDIGGAKYFYTYDNARQLLTQTNTRGQNLNYSYDAAGEDLRTMAGVAHQSQKANFNAKGELSSLRSGFPQFKFLLRKINVL
ncbi:YD repeat protein (3 repeats) [Achromobacter piechaudii ATCC 43553]|uniref:YD repeat protein (3 repeats) n=1 Tax=Achromobacter piechaudii ATCC 43553 TaxID=742159 RepID=D4XGU0_9BURK|nr:YD repeat protein (3 repeats) [Achromobacter piechaudii ATCC 43553]